MSIVFFTFEKIIKNFENCHILNGELLKFRNLDKYYTELLDDFYYTKKNETSLQNLYILHLNQKYCEEICLHTRVFKYANGYRSKISERVQMNNLNYVQKSGKDNHCVFSIITSIQVTNILMSSTIDLK